MTSGNGLPCTKCQTSEWYKNGSCKYCIRSHNKQYHIDNADSIKLRKQQHYIDNADKAKDIARIYREKNQDRIKQYYLDNKERIAEYGRRYNINNPDKQRLRTQRRRAKKYNAKGSFTQAEWLGLIDCYDYHCLCCGEKFDIDDLERDHIIPITKGGSDYISNIQPLCRTCNASKYTDDTDFRLTFELPKRLHYKL